VVFRGRNGRRIEAVIIRNSSKQDRSRDNNEKSILNW
jgi:hypothetical protein